MSKAVETLKRLTGARVSYRILEEFACFPDVPQIGTSAPDYKLALDLFNERFPEKANENKWMRIRQGFHLAFEEFHNELENKLDLLSGDKENRLIYLRRLLKKLYTGQYNYQKHEAFVDYFKSDSFKALKGSLDHNLWEELDTIGYAVWVSQGYTRGTDYTLEQELKLEGFPLEHGWLSEDTNINVENNRSRLNSEEAVGSTVETLKGLINSNKSYGQLMQLGQLPGFEEITPVAPDYNIAFKYFDSLYPKISVLGRNDILGIVYRKVHEEFVQELETKLDALLVDKENRVVYLKRLFDKLYTTQGRNQNLMKIESAISSDKFEALRGKIDTNLWLDLKEIGFAILQSVTYASAVGKRLEQELEANGIVINGGYITKSIHIEDVNPSEKAHLKYKKIRDTKELTDREEALIHCYKDLPPINKGERLYNDYIAFCTVRKRIGYPNESKSKAKSLIQSIEKILPRLSVSEKQQAQNEIDTIRSNFSN